jgi:hypothetical protein
MQRAVNTTIAEAAFFMWFAYISCWATDVFYGSASRLYEWYTTESNQNENENEWGETSAVKEERFG